jgi:hypothetical protein
MWNGISADERLRLWKKFRDDIKDHDLNQQLQQIAIFFSTTPYGSRTLDYYNPINWPTPWEILYRGSFCISSISLLIFYTLTLLSTIKTLELFVIEDEREDIYLLPVIDNNIVLNYYLGEVNRYTEIEHRIKVLKKYSQFEIKSIL